MKRMSAPLAVLLVLTCSSLHAATRTWYIAVEETDWNYFPAGPGQLDTATLDNRQRQQVNASDQHLGSIYKKVIYRAYTDDTFTTLAEHPAWQGFLGPVLHAEAGDHINVVLRNNAARPYSFVIDGLMENSISKQGNRAVPPGATYRYQWDLDASAGPGPNDPSSVAWFYHSDVDRLRDLQSGLAGMLIVTRRGLARTDATPVDVDHEWVMVSAITDENQSWYIPDNETRVAEKQQGKRDFVRSNRMANINGFSHGTLPTPVADVCSRIRVYHLALAASQPLLSLRWEGNNVLIDGQRRSSIDTPYDNVSIAQLSSLHAGTWRVEASQPALRQQGLYAHYQLTPSDQPCH